MIFHKGPFLTYQRDKATLAILKLGPLDPGGLLHPRSYFSRASPGRHPQQGSWQVENLLRRGAVCSLVCFPLRKATRIQVLLVVSLGSPRPRTGGPNPSSSRAWRPGTWVRGIHCFEFPALKAPPSICPSAPVRKRHPARLAPG